MGFGMESIHCVSAFISLVFLWNRKNAEFRVFQVNSFTQRAEAPIYRNCAADAVGPTVKSTTKTQKLIVRILVRKCVRYDLVTTNRRWTGAPSPTVPATNSTLDSHNKNSMHTTSQHIQWLAFFLYINLVWMVKKGRVDKGMSRKLLAISSFRFDRKSFWRNECTVIYHIFNFATFADEERVSEVRIDDQWHL